MSPEIPVELEQAIEELISEYPIVQLRERVAQLSSHYRLASRPARGYVTSALDAAAYAAFRMPAAYAAISAVLDQIRLRLPDWEPATTLDIGAGTGAGLWAISRAWSCDFEASLIDTSREMLALGKALAGTFSDLRFDRAKWSVDDAARLDLSRPASLVLSSYVMNEQPLEARSTMLDRLWAATGELLVIIEPGTPAGFDVIRELRSELTASGAHILAPCPHGDRCPMPDNDWCHFSVRLPRSRLHREVKPGELGYEDEKFSYVVASKSPVQPATGRILRHPTYRRGMAQVVVCGPDGIETRTVTRGKQRELFRYARDASWGDEFPGH